MRARWQQRSSFELERYALLAAALPSLALQAAGRLRRRAAGAAYEIVEEPRDYADICALYERMGVAAAGIYLIQNAEFIDWALTRAKIPCRRYYAYEGDRLAGKL